METDRQSAQEILKKKNNKKYTLKYIIIKEHARTQISPWTLNTEAGHHLPTYNIHTCICICKYMHICAQVCDFYLFSFFISIFFFIVFYSLRCCGGCNQAQKPKINANDDKVVDFYVCIYVYVWVSLRECAYMTDMAYWNCLLVVLVARIVVGLGTNTVLF